MYRGDVDDGKEMLMKEEGKISKPLLLCGIFYGVLCIFSLVTGGIYISGTRELNPLELSDRMMAALSDPEVRRAFAIKMGYVTFVVGIIQGITSFSILKGKRPAAYWIALGFTLFSILSVSYKLFGRINAFPILKSIAYIAILAVLLLPGTRARYFSGTGRNE